MQPQQAGREAVGGCRGDRREEREGEVLLLLLL